MKLGKNISYALRHNPKSLDLEMSENGWVNASELICALEKHKKFNIDMKILCDLVEKDDKQRYSFNEDKTLIRANQGHSINVDVELEEKQPPDILYHGTATKFKNSIDEIGLIPKTRQYVHLSLDEKTANIVGKRHGETIIYKINSKKMFEDGYKFYLSKNNVWLAKFIPTDFFLK
ncbi:MAG: RNA 2'-phosphotransferase [Clostridia bacterium]